MSNEAKMGKPVVMDRLRKKKPLERIEHIYLDDETTQAYNTAAQALAQAQFLNPDDKHLELEKAAEDAKAALRKQTETLLFRSLRRLDMEELVAAHPPTPEQIAAHRELVGPDDLVSMPQYNEDTFSRAIVQATVKDPKTGECALTIEDVNEIWDDWNAAEISQLYAAALSVCQSRRTTDLGKAFGTGQS